MGAEGPEQGAEKAENSRVFATGGAKGGAIPAAIPAVDPELAEVMRAWPALPAALRAGIWAMVRASHVP